MSGIAYDYWGIKRPSTEDFKMDKYMQRHGKKMRSQQALPLPNASFLPAVNTATNNPYFSPPTGSSPENDPANMGPHEARAMLENVQQSTETTQKYFNRCFALFEKGHGREVQPGDVHFFTPFVNGLNPKLKEAVRLSGVRDNFSARKVAIQEEIFMDAEKYKKANNNENERINNLEIMSHAQWDKIKSCEGMLVNYKNDMENVKHELTDIKDMLRKLLDQSIKEDVTRVSEDHAIITNMTKLHKELDQKVEQTINERINVTISAAFDGKLDAKLEEKLNEKFGEGDAFDEKMRIGFIEMTRMVAANYDWSRHISRDLNQLSEGLLPRQQQYHEQPVEEFEHAPSPPSPIPTPPVPTKQLALEAPPFQPQFFVGIKRSLSECGDLEYEESSAAHGDNQNEQSPKRARLLDTELYVLGQLKETVPDHIYEEIEHGDILEETIRQRDIIHRRLTDIRRWMDLPQKPLKRDCRFCSITGHHDYNCHIVTTISARIEKLKAENRCLECSKHHSTKKCTTEKLACRICQKAETEGALLLRGKEHCKMLCPLQEEFHAAIRTRDVLNSAVENLQHAH